MSVTKSNRPCQNNRLNLSCFNLRLENMVTKFSDNSIKAAERIGEKLDDMADSMNPECDQQNTVEDEDDIDSVDIQYGGIHVGNDNRRFLDHILENAPELYEQLGRFSRELRRLDEDEKVKKK